MLELDSWVEIKEIAQVKAPVDLPACHLHGEPFQFLVQPLKVAQSMEMVLQELFLPLAASAAQIPLVLELKVQEQEEAPLLGHLCHHQDHPQLEVRPLGNLAWMAPFLDPLVVASEQVPV